MEQKKSKKILIIIADFYQEISENLQEGALEKLQDEGFIYDLKCVPGTLEIPIVLRKFLEHYEGFIILTCLIKGETDHYQIVKDLAVREIYKLAYSKNVAIGTGIITANNYEQALSRSKLSGENYGGRAANACIKLIKILND